MPTYLPPNFNVATNRWHAGQDPSAVAPAVSGQLMQFYVNSRIVNMGLHGATGKWLPFIIVREPIAASTHAAIGDLLEPVARPGDTYIVFFIQRIHMGFPNAYNMLYCFQTRPNGTIPRNAEPA